MVVICLEKTCSAHAETASVTTWGYFEKGQIVIAGWLSQSMSESTRLVDCLVSCGECVLNVVQGGKNHNSPARCWATRQLWDVKEGCSVWYYLTKGLLQYKTYHFDDAALQSMGLHSRRLDFLGQTSPRCFTPTQLSPWLNRKWASLYQSEFFH